jgi:hypothetical protein
MRIFLTITFFLFLNFMLLLMPKLMPNVISTDKILFWVFWVNGLGLLTLVLPDRASYIFKSTGRGAMITQAIFKQMQQVKQNYTGSDLEADKKKLALAKKY